MWKNRELSFKEGDQIGLFVDMDARVLNIYVNQEQV